MSRILRFAHLVIFRRKEAQKAQEGSRGDSPPKTPKTPRGGDTYGTEITWIWTCWSGFAEACRRGHGSALRSYPCPRLRSGRPGGAKGGPEELVHPGFMFFRASLVPPLADKQQQIPLCGYIEIRNFTTIPEPPGPPDQSRNAPRASQLFPTEQMECHLIAVARFDIKRFPFFRHQGRANLAAVPGRGV